MPFSNKRKEKAYQKKYYQENREKLRAKQRKYEQENREKINARRREYRQKNPEKARGYQKKYRQKNPEKIKAKDERSRQELKNKYVIARLRSTGIKLDKHPKKLIELKRIQLLMFREIKKGKEIINGLHASV